MIGKLLRERYQIVQVLSAGAFGRIYIAEDIHQPDNPKCVIKHIKPPSSDPKYLKTARRRFAAEAQVLKKLGHHEQIPLLYACFEENQEFYLVQEFIEGHPLSAELPISTEGRAFNSDQPTAPSANGYSLLLGYRWTEDECTQLLRELLFILEFVHTQGFLHCDIKPNNIIRRLCDGKLFLIDFGAVQLVPHELGSGVAVTNEKLADSKSKPPTRKPKSHNLRPPLGYIPIEQLRGYPYPNSDIYALGLIAIQALTGLDPATLKVNPDTGEVMWQQQALVSEGLAAVINKMVRYDFKNRYQSASEALQALSSSLANSQEESGIVRHYLGGIPLQMPNWPVTASAISTQAKLILHFLSLFVPKPSPFRNVVAAGIAANTLVILFGIFSLLYAFGLQPEPEVLSKAQEQFQEGDLDGAIATAKSIPANHPAYPEAEAAIEEWRRDWSIAATEFQVAEQAFNDGHWLDVLEEERKIPAISFWRQKIEPLIHQAKAQMEAEAQQLLQKAYERALEKDFTTALEILKQIPPDTSVSKTVQQKLAEYKKKQNIKADYLLGQAYKRAEVKDFLGALSFIKQIPEEASAYKQAQAKIAEYSQMQRLLEEAQKEEKPTSTPSPTPSPQLNDSSGTRNANGKIQDLNPGNHLTEITLKQTVKR